MALYKVLSHAREGVWRAQTPQNDTAHEGEGPSACPEKTAPDSVVMVATLSLCSTERLKPRKENSRT